MVLSQRQTHSDGDELITGKWIFNKTSPYIVLSHIFPSFYLIRHLPFSEGFGQTGVLIEAITIHLQNIPFTIYIYKILYLTGNIISVPDSPVTKNPLVMFQGYLYSGVPSSPTRIIPHSSRSFHMITSTIHVNNRYHPIHNHTHSQNRDNNVVRYNRIRNRKMR